MRPNWFIGIPVPAATWLDEVRTGAPEGLKMFSAGDVHLTVAFLGGVEPEAARAAWEASGRFPFSPMRIKLGPLKAFGPRRQPSALSFVLDEGRDALVAYIGASRRAMWDAAGARHDDRPPLPHVTIARIPRKATPALRRACLDWAGRIVPPAEPIVLDRLALYTWADDRPVPQFRIVEERTY